MSWMLEILILSYTLKEVTNLYVLHCFEFQRFVHISTTRCPIEMGLNEQVIYIENSKSNVADMWPISVDHFTYAMFSMVGSPYSRPVV